MVSPRSRLLSPRSVTTVRVVVQPFGIIKESSLPNGAGRCRSTTTALRHRPPPASTAPPWGDDGEPVEEGHRPPLHLEGPADHGEPGGAGDALALDGAGERLDALALEGEHGAALPSAASRAGTHVAGARRGVRPRRHEAFPRLTVPDAHPSGVETLLETPGSIGVDPRGTLPGPVVAMRSLAAR
jgi:hypothetical protein